MDKALVKIISSHKMFMCQPKVKMFVVIFRTFGMQSSKSMKRSQFAGDFSEQGNMQKGSFQRMV